MEQKKLRISLKADRKSIKEQAKLKMLQLIILQKKSGPMTYRVLNRMQETGQTLLD